VLDLGTHQLQRIFDTQDDNDLDPGSVTYDLVCSITERSIAEHSNSLEGDDTSLEITEAISREVGTAKNKLRDITLNLHEVAFPTMEHLNPITGTFSQPETKMRNKNDQERRV